MSLRSEYVLKGLCEASEAGALGAEEEHNTLESNKLPKTQRTTWPARPQQNKTKSFNQFIKSGFDSAPDCVGDMFCVSLAETLWIWFCKLRPEALGFRIDAFQGNVLFPAATTCAFPPATK